MKAVDWSGIKLGALTIIERNGTNNNNKALWLCRCDCGNEITRAAPELSRAKRDGVDASCGCLKNRALEIDITGDTYHRLTVQQRSDENRKKWVCQCACGNTHTATANDLRTGAVKSCGCLKEESSRVTINIARQHMTPKKRDYTGVKKNRLTLISPTNARSGGSVIWNATCDCGGTIQVLPQSVLSGNTGSCGCLKADSAVLRGEKMRGVPNMAARRSSEKHIGNLFGKLTLREIKYVEYHLKEAPNLAYGVCDCECGAEYEARMSDLTTGRTVSCGCGTNISGIEQQIADWLSGYTDIEQQKEINGWKYDICVPSKKLLIEYNGVWWHSAKYLHDKVHLIKRRNAEDEGFTVINVWADDYERKSDRIKSLILHRLGLVKATKIGARKVNLSEVDRATAMRFHAENHIQAGPPTGGQHIGVFFVNVMVGVATFKRNKQTTELTRLSISPDVTIHGVLSKVVSHISSNKPIITFCDRDYFTGNSYRMAGFEKAGTSRQMTYSENGRSRVRRERYMRNKIAQPGDTRSEKAILESWGIYQCWNSGIDKWVLNV